MGTNANTQASNAHLTTPTRLTGAEIVWATLVGEGVTDVFGYPGGAILPVYDALRKFPIHHVLVRHEQGAAHMADGYARASGKVGVAMATSGPGATNLVTGIATAMLDSIPMVCITGKVSSKVLGTDAFQEVDITGITLPVTKHNFLVNRTEDIAPALREAFQIARSGRPGPVLVDITKDAQQGTAIFDFEAAKPRPYRPHPMLQVEESGLAQAAELIRNAKRPVILAGHGVIESGAMEQVRTLAERAQIPVALTLLGLGGFPASHPLNLGMMGMHGEAWVNHAIQEADLLIACGMRFDDRVTGTLATYAPKAKKIHIEVDPAEINKNVKVDVALVGDLREVLEQLLPRIPGRDGSAWLKTIEASKGAVAVRDIKNLPDSGHLYAAHVMHDLWRITGGNAIVVTDVGQHQMWEAQYFHHEQPRTLDHLRRPGHHGLRAARGHRRQVRLPGQGSLGHRRRRRLPDDRCRAVHHRAGRHQDQHRHHQQRLPGHGAPVAGVLLRAQLRSHAAGQPRLRQARRRARHRRPHGPHPRRSGSCRRRSALRTGRLPAQLHGRKGRFGLSDDSRRQRIARDDPPPRQEPAGRIAGRQVQTASVQCSR